MAGFGLGKGGVIKDSSFVYIEWEGKDSPKHNAAIKDLIDRKTKGEYARWPK